MIGTAAMLPIAGRILVPRDRITVDAELTVPDAARIAVIGANGAGKSTLLGALAGLAPLDRRSTVTSFGTPLRRLPLDRRQIGYLAQDGLLFPHLRALDNVAFATGLPKSPARIRANELLTELGAAHLATAMPDELSGGERQRVALARALAAAPRILVLDEPFAALDVTAAAELRELVAAAATRHGLTVLFASHDLVDVVRLAERVLVLESGRVVEDLSVTELQRRPRSGFAAEFAGLARIVGEVTDGSFRCAAGAVTIAGRFGDAPAAGQAALLVTPAAVAAVSAAEADWVDRVVALVGDGAEVLAQLASGLRMRLTVPQADGALPTDGELQVGDAVPIRIRAGELVSG